MSDLEIRPVPYDSPEARDLLHAAHEDLVERYGSGDENPVDPRDFDPPHGSFLVAWLDGEAVACGGWRTLPSRPADPGDGVAETLGDGVAETLGDGVAEIKRMYATPAVRGTGVAAALLRAIEDSARECGRRRMVLETGLPQAAAIAFYTKHGYERITNYAFYRDYPDCRSFARDL